MHYVIQRNIQPRGVQRILGSISVLFATMGKIPLGPRRIPVLKILDSRATGI